ncbi:MAG: hypothetical protein JXD18_04705 [Anaerolineae bacterium]|nr:hypothetical protein [Anaerolineae bacterium]
MSEEELAQVLAVKRAHEKDLMQKPNVVGVGVGMRSRGGQFTGEPAIVVSVSRKVPRNHLAPQDVIPSELDGVPVDVQAIGFLRVL